MKATVLLITYNHASFIRQAVESALAQKTDFDYQILISDDCSTDGTREIVCDYARQHPQRIRLRLNQVNRNSNEDFEEALLLASDGEYVAFLEGDDYWTSPFKLQKAVDVLEQHPDIVLCWHGMRFVDVDGQPTPLQEPPLSQTIFSADDLYGYCPMACVGAVVARVSSIRPPLPAWYASSPIGDFPLYMVSVRHGSAFYLDRVLGDYRIHSGGFWNKHNEIEKAQLSLATFRNFANNVEPELRTKLKRYLSNSWAHCALTYKRSGDSHSCRDIAKAGLAECPNDPRLLLLAYTPQLWEPIRAIVKNLQKFVPSGSRPNHSGVTRVH